MGHPVAESNLFLCDQVGVSDWARAGENGIITPSAPNFLYRMRFDPTCPSLLSVHMALTIPHSPTAPCWCSSVQVTGKAGARRARRLGPSSGEAFRYISYPTGSSTFQQDVARGEGLRPACGSWKGGEGLVVGTGQHMVAAKGGI